MGGRDFPVGGLVFTNASEKISSAILCKIWQYDHFWVKFGTSTRVLICVCKGVKFGTSTRILICVGESCVLSIFRRVRVCVRANARFCLSVWAGLWTQSRINLRPENCRGHVARACVSCVYARLYRVHRYVTRCGTYFILHKGRFDTQIFVHEGNCHQHSERSVA